MRLTEASRSQGAVRPATASTGREEAGGQQASLCLQLRPAPRPWTLALGAVGGQVTGSRRSAVQTHTLQFPVPEPRRPRGDRMDVQVSPFSVTSGCSRSQTRDPCGRGQLSALALATGQRTQRGRFLPSPHTLVHELESPHFHQREPRGLQAAAPDSLSHHFLSPLPTLRPPTESAMAGHSSHQTQTLKPGKLWSGLSTSSGSTRVPLVRGAPEAQLDDTGLLNITFTNTEKPDSRVSCFTARFSLLCGSATRPRYFQGISARSAFLTPTGGDIFKLTSRL